MLANTFKNTKKLLTGVVIVATLTVTANAVENSFTKTIKNHMTNTTESIMSNTIRTSDLSVESIAANLNGDIWLKFDNNFEKDTCSNKFGFRFVIKNGKGNVLNSLFGAQKLNRKVQILYKPSVTPDANSTYCKLANILLVIFK